MATQNDGKLTTREAIEAVLKSKRGKAMRVPEIVALCVPMTRLAGRTPGQVVYSTIYSEAKKVDGIVIQTGRGGFKLNPKRKSAAKPAASKS